MAAILEEPQSPDYWFAASRDGNREAHYRGAHLGATLAHPLQPEQWVKGWDWEARNRPGGWGPVGRCGSRGCAAPVFHLDRPPARPS